MTAPRGSFGAPRPWPVSFTVDGDQLTLPPLGLRWWLHSLALDPPWCWWSLIPASLPDPDAELVAARLADNADRLDIDDMEDVATAVLGDALGVWFWAAHRLAQLAHANWFTLDGWFVRRGFDPTSAPPGRVLSGVYMWRLEGCEKESDVAKVDRELWAAAPPMLPSGRARDAAPVGWDDAQEASMFDSALANLGARGTG